MATITGAPGADFVLGTLSARELLEWQRYLAFGTPLMRLFDTHLAGIRSTLTNVFRTRKTPYKVRDFLMLTQDAGTRSVADKEGSTAQASPELLMQKLIMLKTVFGGEVIDKRARTD